jgi:hypothetical protein
MNLQGRLVEDEQANAELRASVATLEALGVIRPREMGIIKFSGDYGSESLYIKIFQMWNALVWSHDGAVLDIWWAAEEELREVGYSNSVQRLDEHAAYSSSSFLIHLAKVICDIELQKKYHLDQYVVALSAVNSAFQKVMALERRRMREELQRIRSEAREEMEAEKEWWRGEVQKVRAEVNEEVEKVRSEVQAALRAERNGREAAKERIRAGIRETERAMTLLGVNSETWI